MFHLFGDIWIFNLIVACSKLTVARTVLNFCCEDVEVCYESDFDHRIRIRAKGLNGVFDCFVRETFGNIVIEVEKEPWNKKRLRLCDVLM